ncbi:EamA/RhaT family transporter, partial [Bacillus sp. HC-Mk]
MLFKWIVGICITIMVIISSIVGGKKLLAYVEKENTNIQIERAANEKEKKAAEELTWIQILGTIVVVTGCYLFSHFK